MSESNKHGNRVCVLASSRPWNRDMVTTLAARTGYRFELIVDPKQLSADVLAALAPRYVFFPHWSHRIDPAVYNAFECIVFHMTDLPFGRGGSPLQNLIVRGIYETKISALRCVASMDAGPIYLKRPLNLHGAAEEIFLRAAKVMEDMIVEILDTAPVPVAQTGEPTVFKRRTPEQGNLADTRTLQEAFDLIRMLDAQGYPHAYVDVGPFRLEFTRASLKTGQVTADVRITPRQSVDEPK